jgi:putative membrane protein
MTLRFLSPILVALVLGTTPAVAQTTRPTPPQNPPKTPAMPPTTASPPGSPVKEPDKSAPSKAKSPKADPRDFADDAMRMAVKEIAAGKLAAARATDADVKTFAARLVADHEKALKELRALFARRQWESTTSTPAEPVHGEVGHGWSALQGAALERAFLDEQIVEHEKAVAMFDVQSKTGSDGDLRAWASKQLPTLKEHLATARELAKPRGGA